MNHDHACMLKCQIQIRARKTFTQLRQYNGTEIPRRKTPYLARAKDEHLKNQMQLRTLTNAQAQNSNPITFVALLCEFIAIALIFGLI